MRGGNMSDYNKYVNKEIKPRVLIIGDRYKVFEWELDRRLPNFIHEKMNEIKNMVVLGLDHFAVKCIAIFIEEILQHMVIANEAEFIDDYIDLLEKYKRKSGHHFLKILKERNLIHTDDYEFCSKYCNDYDHGGQRLRNIELHNLMAEKIDKFTLRKEVQNNIDDFGKEFLENEIKKNPEFVHIGSKDMNSRNILREVVCLNDLVNRNALILSKLNNLKQKRDIVLDKSKFFAITINFKVKPVSNVIEVLEPLSFINSVTLEKEEAVDDGYNYSFRIETKQELEVVDLIQSIYDMKKHDFTILQTKILPS
jgi:hypothetical protein